MSYHPLPVCAGRKKSSSREDTQSSEKAEVDDIPFSAEISRARHPGVRFNNLNIELKDEQNARQEKGNQISRYIEHAEAEGALVGYIRLDEDYEFERQYMEHPRYLRPPGDFANFTWVELIDALFGPRDKLRTPWIRAVHVFCEKKVEWTPTFPEIQTAARKALALEQLPFSPDTLADYAHAVCAIYSMNVDRFQNECLKPAIESEMRSRKIETTVVVTGSDYKKLTFSGPLGTVRLKWSETFPVERRRGAPQAALEVLRAPCNWIDPGDGYVPKQRADWMVIAGRPVFPYLSYGTIETLTKAIVDAVC